MLRHAKSSWANPGQRDFDRGLNERGNADLPAIAAYMVDREYQPSLVLCSPAVRTRATLTGISSALVTDAEIRFEQALYDGDAAQYLHLLQTLPGNQPAIIIGHNPMCEVLTMQLAGQGDPAALAEMATKYPTGALAVFDLPQDQWAQVQPRSGYLVDFACPRDL